MAAGRQQWQHQPCAQLHHRPQQPPWTQDRPGGGDAGQSEMNRSFQGGEEGNPLSVIVCTSSLHSVGYKREKKLESNFLYGCLRSLNHVGSAVTVLIKFTCKLAESPRLVLFSVSPFDAFDSTGLLVHLSHFPHCF